MLAAVLLTCFNRKEKTLSCLESIYAQSNKEGFTLKVYLVDDGSTDGTSEAVKKNFPQVNVIKGDGTLFWNGGMRVAFSKAMENEHDYYLWLNDDTFIYPDSLKILIETSKSIKLKKELWILGLCIHQILISLSRMLTAFPRQIG